MNGPKRLRQEHRQEEVLGQRQETRGLQFDSVEELLRHDRAQTSPPPEIPARLSASRAAQPPKPLAWWKRLLPKW